MATTSLPTSTNPSSSANPNSTNTPWTPLAGSYEVSLGLNLRSALRARRGGSPKEQRKFVKREFYSVRCACPCL